MKQLSLVAALSLLLALGCTSESKPAEAEMAQATATVAEAETAPKKQLRHVVLFKFKETATEADIKTVEDAFAALPGKIPEIKGYEWGTNNSPEGLNKGFTHCFFLTFDSEEGRAAYLPHPDHKAFGAILGPFLEDVTVVDYWTGGE